MEEDFAARTVVVRAEAGSLILVGFYFLNCTPPME
jgi:hypothetical protein